MALAILRDVPDAGVRGLARGRARHVDAVQLDVAPVRRRACRRGPGSARSARCRRRPRCRRSRPRARSSRGRAPPRARDRRAPTGRAPTSTVSPGCAAPRATSSSTSRPTISSARLRSLAPSRSIVATFLPRRSTEMRSATSSTSCSLCVIRMIDVPPRDERAQHGEQLVDLLRRQHRGRLVEDQDARVRGTAP